MKEEQEDKLYCPNCGSSQLVANKKGFGAGKALTGAVLTGGIGLLAGFIGSGKVKVTCLECGCTWKPGELLTEPPKKEEPKYDENGNQVQEEDYGGCAIAIGIISLIFIFAAIFGTCS